VPTPTDPAYDLKTSLAELMRDLRRAGAFDPPPFASSYGGFESAEAHCAKAEPVQPAERPAYRTNEDEYYSALQAAE
jgi:hypothetical protein